MFLKYISDTINIDQCMLCHIKGARLKKEAHQNI